MRPQAKWNIAIQNRVRALKTEMMHSSKTTLATNQDINKEMPLDSLYLASSYMSSRTTTLLVSEGLASHCDVRLAACLRANVRQAQEIGQCLHSRTMKQVDI